MTSTSPHRTPGDPVLRRIRGLLDQAESTSYTSEAEAFAAKAAELMARHHIDMAMLDRSRRQQDRTQVVEVDIDLGRGQYVRARLALLGAVADAYDCRLLSSSTHRGRVGHVVGHTADVEAVSLMYTSLLVQATRAAAAERIPRGHSAVTFKRGFLLGFAARVGERLADHAQAAARAADTEAQGAGRSASPSVAVVLADRRARVDTWIDAHYPSLRRLGPTAPVSAAGVDRGALAGERADIGTASVPASRVGLPR